LSGAKEISSSKDALARKIDVAISSLQDETTGFETIRKEFINIQSHIKDEIGVVKKQLVELERYESLRKNLDKDIGKQKDDYEGFVKDAQEKLKLESQKYEELKGVIEKERKNLEQYGQKLDELRKLRSDYERTLGSLKESLKNIDNVMNDYRKKFEDSDNTIAIYKKALDKLNEELSEKKGSLLTKKLVELKANEDRLFKNQLEIENEIKSGISSFQSYSSVGDKVHKSFDGYFTKNIATEKLIAEIENDKTDLSKDLESLKQKVLTFTLMTTNSTIKSQLKELSYKLDDYEHKKLSIRYKIEKLVGMIKGN
jgi:chromosome segregation ATPase